MVEPGPASGSCSGSEWFYPPCWSPPSPPQAFPAVTVPPPAPFLSLSFVHSFSASSQPHSMLEAPRFHVSPSHHPPPKQTQRQEARDAEEKRGRTGQELNPLCGACPKYGRTGRLRRWDRCLYCSGTCPAKRKGHQLLIIILTDLHRKSERTRNNDLQILSLSLSKGHSSTAR